jgi:hypothetical protein
MKSMKKHFTLLLVSLAITTSVQAQLTFIPKVGVTYSSVAYSDDIKDAWGADIGSKPGFIVGVAAEIPLGGEVLALQPELLWHQKGFRYEYAETGYKEDYKYTFNYLEIPVLIKVKAANFYALAGPSVGYGIIGKYKGTYTENGADVDDSDWVYFGGEPSDYDEDEEFYDNALDIGMQVGAGVNLSALVIELRYGFGITNLYDERPAFTGDVKSQNRSIQLTLGVRLGGNRN